LKHRVSNNVGGVNDPKEWWDGHWIKDHIAKRIDLPGFSN
jgi:hypothetical protein